jgi:DNA-binding protein H-NS
MAEIRLEKLSEAELKKLIRRAETELSHRQVDAKKEAKKRLLSVAKELGFSLSDLLGEGAPRRGRPPVLAKASEGAAKAKLPPKYRNPADANQTWSGHGKRPTWVREHVEAGRDVAELLIGARRGRAASAKSEATKAPAGRRPKAKPSAAKAVAAKGRAATKPAVAKPRTRRAKAAPAAAEATSA